MLKAAYVLLLIMLFGLILFVFNSAMKKNKIASKSRIKNLIAIVLGLTMWLTIQYTLSEVGFYTNTTLPPRIPLFMIFPLFLFSILFFIKFKKNTTLYSIPLHIPIAYQSFRLLIEILFYFTFLQGILPIQVTFEGVNYDVFIGVSAIFMALYAFKKNASKRILIIWNVIGIGVVAFAAFVFITSFYFPHIWNQQNTPQEFNQFPFLLLPAFFMPSAIFVHVLSITQLTKKII